jgi:hypothetical protein
MPGKQKRCKDGYGVKSLEMLRIAKDRGMHLNADGKIVLPNGKVANSKPQWGRSRINLGINGVACTIQTARAVCFLAWGEPPTNNSVADHIDGDTLNDHPSNLRWATYGENMLNNKFTRVKTREQKCVEYCAGINPEAVPEMLEALRAIISVPAEQFANARQFQAWCELKSRAALAKAEGK